MDSNNIDKWAAEDLTKREIKPRNSVWDQLETQLNNPSSNSGINGQNYSVFRILWVTGVILFLTMFLILWIFPDQNTKLQSPSMIEPQGVSHEKNTKYFISDDENKKEISEDIQPSSTLPREDEVAPLRPFHEENINFISPKTITEKSNDSKSKDNNKKGNQEAGRVLVDTNPPIAQLNKKENESIQLSPLLENEKRKSQININADELLAEVQNDLSKKNKKYKIDPAALLKSAEKESNERFFHKLVKTLTETSNVVYAAVNNRNVEP